MLLGRACQLQCTTFHLDYLRGRLALEGVGQLLERGVIHLRFLTFGNTTHHRLHAAIDGTGPRNAHGTVTGVGAAVVRHQNAREHGRGTQHLARIGLALQLIARLNLVIGIAPPVAVRVVQPHREAVVVIAHRVDHCIITLLDSAHPLQQRIVFGGHAVDNPRARFDVQREVAIEGLGRNAASKAQFGDPLHVGERGRIELTTIGKQVIRQLHVEVLERVPHAAIAALGRVLAVAGGICVLLVTFGEP